MMESKRHALLSLLVAGCLFGITLGQGRDPQEQPKIAAIHSPPFFIVERDENGTTYSGLINEYLKKTVKSNCRFKFESLITRDDGEDTFERTVDEIIQNNFKMGVGPFPYHNTHDGKAETPPGISTTKISGEHKGWTAVMRKYVARERNPIMESFTLFRPFDAGVWLAILAAFVAVSLILALLNIVNPYEWRNLYKRDKISKSDANQLSPTASIFVVFSTLTWQGYEKVPRSTAGKILLIFWMAFVAVTLVTYIANLTCLLNYEAHERTHEPATPIRHPFGLMNQEGKDLIGGTITNWPMLKDFDIHPDKTAAKLADHLRTKGKNVKNFEEAVRLLNTEKNYVFVIDTVIGEYLTKDNCELTTTDVIPGENIVNGYRFIEPQKYNCLQGNTEINKEEIMKSLWIKWSNAYKYGRCNKTHQQQEKIPAKPNFYPINVYQFCGPLALAALGIILCVLITIAEIIVHFVSNKLKKVNILGASSPIEEERRLHDDLDDDLKA